MSKLLYITANPKTSATSVSLAVGDEFLAAYREVNPQDEVTVIDLYKTEVPFIDETIISAWGKFAQGQTFDKLSEVEQKNVAAMNAILEQFIAADKYVFVTPLWNFTIPPKMKAYLDNICIVNKTFKYTEKGPIGLLDSKKAVHIQARGGIYSSGPAAALELGDRYINTVLGFLGVTDRQSVIIEGINYTPDKADEIKGKAIAEAKEVAKKF